MGSAASLASERVYRTHVEHIDTSAAGPKSDFNDICAVGGKVCLIPGVGQKMLVHDTLTNTSQAIEVTSAGLAAGGRNRFRSACAVAGRVYLTPEDAEKILVYDPALNSTATIDIPESIVSPDRRRKFKRSCVAAGKVYMSPSMAGQLLCYDPATGKVEGISVSVACSEDVQFKFSGTCEVGGKLYLAPVNAEAMLEYGLTTGKTRRIVVTCKKWPDHHSLKFEDIRGAAGKVVLCPRSAPCILVFDPSTGARTLLQTAAANPDLTGKFSSICEAGGKAYLAPSAATKMVEVDPSGTGADGAKPGTKTIVLPEYYAGHNDKFYRIYNVSGKVCLVSATSGKMFMWDPATRTGETLDLGNADWQFSGLCAAEGKLCLAPVNNAGAPMVVLTHPGLV